MRTLHRLTCTCIGLGVVVFAGCGKKNDAESDTSAMPPAGATTAATPSAPVATPAAAPISLADVAGTWNLRATPDSGRDTSVTTATIKATGTTSGWTITYPGRAAMPMRVSTDGDSIITDVGPYSSVRRKGVKVSTHNVMRLQNGMLVGSTVAHYSVNTADSVMTLRTQSTRAK